MPMKNRLPVAFICDRGYIMQTSVAILSLIGSKDADTVPDIHIVTYGLDEAQERELLALGREDAPVRIVRGDGCFSEDSFPVTESRYRVATKAALLKFYLPRLLPELDRVLYLDGDIIVRRDLAGLGRIELGDCLAAAVRDLPQVFYEKSLLGEGRDYFNSGVMILNLAQMRREGTSEKLIEARRAGADDNLMDQNVLNRVLAGRVLQLSFLYNVCCANLRRRWLRERMLDKLNSAYGTSFRSLSEIRSAAAILHYSSAEKPWKYFDIPAGGEWMEIYRQSARGGRPLRRKCWLIREIELKIKAKLGRL